MGFMEVCEKQVLCLAFSLLYLLGLSFYFCGLTKKILTNENSNFVSNAKNQLTFLEGEHRQ